MLREKILVVVIAIASSNLFQVIYKLREKKRKKKTKKKKQKMKSMNDSNTNDGNNHNWLGFSLSPHMKMDVTSSTGAPQHHHHPFSITLVKFNSMLLTEQLTNFHTN